MEFCLIIVLFIFSFILLKKNFNLEREILKLQIKLNQFIKSQQWPAETNFVPNSENTKAEIQTPDKNKPIKENTHIYSKTYISQTASTTKSITQIKQEFKDKYSDKINWLKENWSGVISVAILTLGIKFIQIYLSINSTPIIRFCSLLSSSILLLTGSIYIRKRFQLWKDLACWLQAASGSIILLTCFGSSYFESLQFYESHVLGLFFLILGLTANLTIAWFNYISYATTFSLILNYLAMYYAPHTLIIQCVIVVTTLASYFIVKKRTNLISLALLSFVYGLFNYFWAYNIFLESDHFYFLFSGLPIYIIPIFISLSQIKTTKINDSLNIASLFILWGGLALQVLMWSPNPINNMIFFAIAGLSLLFASLHLKNKFPQWYCLSNLFVSQFFIGLALYQLINLNINLFFIICFGMVELMFFITLLNRFKNSLTIYSAHGFLIATILGASIKIFYDMLPWTDNLHIKTIHYCYTLYVIALALGVTAYRIRRTETYANYQSLILQSEYTIILFLSLFITSFLSIETVSVLFAMHYLIQKVLFPPSNTANTVALQIGNVVLMTFFVLKHIYWNDIHTQTNFYYFLVGLTPFLLLIRPGFLQLPLRWANRYDFWVYGYGFFITTSFYLIGKKISNFLPGILLLIFSLFICSFQHAIAMCFKRITEKTDQVEKSLFVVVMIALILFVFTHITVHIQSHYYIVPYISFSTILASLAIHVCGICQKQAPTFTNGILVTSHQHKTITDKIFAILSTCAYELILILLIITISLEVAIYLQIFIWGLLSLILIFLYNKFQMPKRIKLYSWIGFFASCLHLAVVTSRWDSPLQTWYSDTHLTGLLGILILFLTGNILIYSSKKDKQSCPSTLTIFYGAIPIFIASILFFFWRFDLAYLTLLIILLNIILIAIGFYWKNIRVIQFGYAALGLCVIRLIGFDLKESDILFRAFIFIGSGIMMILSQIIYSKFKHRLSK